MKPYTSVRCLGGGGEEVVEEEEVFSSWVDE